MSDYRHDFPLLRQYPKLTYLDSAATSQKPEKVIHAVQHYLTYTNSNIHRGQYKLAEQSEDLYRASKESFAQLIGASSPREVIYHHNATACMNLLVQSLIKSEIIAPGDNIVLPITEHHSNIVPRQIAGIHIRWIPITDDYALDLNKLPGLIDSRTRALSLATCSNVTGHMPELSQLKKIIGPDRLLILDACQSLGKYPIDVTTIDADILIGTAHKIFGLTGLGMLRIRRSLLRTLTPARGGGGVVTQVSQKDFTYKSGIEGRESGTPHIVGAISLHAAIQYIASIGGVDTLAQHDQNITSYALQQLTAIPGLSIIGSTTPSTRRAGVISFTIDGHTKTSIAQHMADHNIAIRCGGHCTFPLRDALDEAGSCRMSFHLYTNTSDIDTIVNQLQILSKSR